MSQDKAPAFPIFIDQEKFSPQRKKIDCETKKEPASFQHDTIYKKHLLPIVSLF
jgi:hypothetical protein